MRKFSIMAGMLLAAMNIFADEVTAVAVSAKQRYPWNGLVDIEVIVTGASNAVVQTECAFTATNSATQAALPILHVTGTGTALEKVAVAPETEGAESGAWLRRYVWDAETDVGSVKIGSVTLTVEVKELGGVQLWENGPYWAECNVGATREDEYGYYFWWGDTMGYKRNAGNTGWVSVKGRAAFSFEESTCPTYEKSRSELQTLGYIDSTGNLTARHDAATVHLGSPWRMPTAAEMDALISNCTVTLITNTSGVVGRRVSGKGAYAAKSIFLPAAGFGKESYLYSTNSHGYYWTATPYLEGYYDSWVLYFGMGTFFRNYYRSRHNGWSVRALRDQQ